MSRCRERLFRFPHAGPLGLRSNPLAARPVIARVRDDELRRFRPEGFGPAGDFENVAPGAGVRRNSHQPPIRL